MDPLTKEPLTFSVTFTSSFQSDPASNIVVSSSSFTVTAHLPPSLKDPIQGMLPPLVALYQQIIKQLHQNLQNPSAPDPKNS